MPDKAIFWVGTSYDVLTKRFPASARKEAGHQLSQVQAGLEADHWKPFDDVGRGVREIIVDVEEGWFRMMYVAKFEEGIYVLHCFQKKTNATSQQDKDIARKCYNAVLETRKRKK